MKPLIAFLFLTAPCYGDEPAIAETPRRTYEATHLEINRVVRSDDSHFDQVVSWTLTYDKHDRRYKLIDRGWVILSDATFDRTEDGGYAVECKGMRVEAKQIFVSVTPFDAEIERRDGTAFFEW